MSEQAPEKNETLWVLVAPLAIWGGHFALCWLGASLACSRLAAGFPFERLRPAVLAATAAALAGLGWAAFAALRRRRSGAPPLTTDGAAPLDRRRWLGRATLMLCALAATAVVFSASAALFFEDCR